MRLETLERNVRALLRHSYLPALPAPAFRDRLEALFLAEVARRTAPRPARERGEISPRRGAGVLVALAAALAALLFGWRAFAPGADHPVEGLAGLLERGAVALSEMPGTWRAADANELARGLDYAGPRLRTATPGERGFTVRAAGGELRVLEDSEVELSGDPVAPRAELRHGRATWRFRERLQALAVGTPLELNAPESAAPPSSVASAPGPRPAREEVVPEAVTPVHAARAPDLRGRVLEASTGDPVTHFTVGLLGRPVDTTPTVPVTRTFESADGTFTWPDAPRGPQRVFVHAPGFALAQLGEHSLPMAADEALAVGLDPGVALSGSVLDPEGNPIPNALVLPEGETPVDSLTFRSPESQFWLPVLAHTGRDGRFALPHLSPGPHTLRVTADGWAPTWMQLDLPRAAGAAEPEIRMTLGGTITGRATGADGGPTAGALLIAMPMDASEGQRRSHFDLVHSDADGRYRFEHLPAGSMIVVLTSQVAPPEVRPVRLREAEVETVDFATPRGGTRLTGILRAADGRPLPLQNLALVDFAAAQRTSWNQSWVASTTDPVGRYLFEGVAPGLYQIHLIEEQGRGIRFVDQVLVDESPEFTHDVRVAPGTLRLRVLSRDGRPEPGAIFFLTRRTPDGWTFAGHTRSDAFGQADFTGLIPGTYAVEACPTRDGVGLARETDLVVSAATPEVAATLELTEGGSVSVLVLDPEGRPVENVQLFFVDALGIEHTGSLMPFTDDSGRFRGHGLPPGEYTLRARGTDGARITHTFQQVLGIDPELRLVLPPSRSEEER